MGLEKWLHKQINNLIDIESDKEYLLFVAGMFVIGVLMYAIVG